LERLLQLTPAQIGDIWKDQRELSIGEVVAIARFLNVSAAEVALRAGVSTPVPQPRGMDTMHLVQLAARVERLERTVDEIAGVLRRAGLK